MPADPDPYRNRLDAALAEVDRVFADLPDPGRVAGCTWCYAEEDLGRLGGDPAEVPDHLLRHFAHEGPEHWSASQYGLLWRRFAPRILRTAAYRREELIIPWALRGPGSPPARFADWPDAQRAALTGAYAALLDVALVGWPAEDVVELLGPLAQLGDDIAPWFARIDASTGPAADAGLVRLAAHWSDELLAGTSPYWYWYPDDPVGLATAWLCSPAVCDRVAAFAGRHPGCRTAALADAALAVLAVGEPARWWFPEEWHGGCGRAGCADCAPTPGPGG